MEATNFLKNLVIFLWGYILYFIEKYPLYTIGVFIGLFFVIMLYKIFTASNRGYDPNQNKIKHWG